MDNEMCLKTVSVESIKPNPFRRLDEYPVDRIKVDTLKESIQSTGFWGTIVARQRGENYEIAFGHHRTVAIQELGLQFVNIIVRELTNEQMLQMMARENLEEWGSRAFVEMETVRATIEAYGKDEISLPPVPKKTPCNNIMYVSEAPLTHPYTKALIADFLGWTSKTRDLVQPNFGCEVAFHAIELINKGLLEPRDFKNLSRYQLHALMTGQVKIYRTEMRLAQHYHNKSDQEHEAAASAETPDERETRQKREKHFKKLAHQHEKIAKTNVRRYVDAANEAYDKKCGAREIERMADKFITCHTKDPEGKLHTVEEFVRRVTKQLYNFETGEKLNKDINFLRNELKRDLDDAIKMELCQQFRSTITWLEGLYEEFLPHAINKGNNNGSLAIRS